MEIGVRDLRNRTASVIDAVKAGERVVLTVNGDPLADIVPHGRALTEQTAGLLDTSAFIARETGWPLGELPERVAISVVTIGELQLGVLNANNDEARTRRADTIALARAADPIPISEVVMTAWARLVANCKAADIQRMVKH